MAPAADGNQQVFDASVRYAVFLQRYTTGAVRRLDEFLRDLDAEAAAKLESMLSRLSEKDQAAYIRGTASTRRVEKLRETLQQMQRDTARELRERVAEEVVPLAERVAQRQAANAAAIAVEASMPQIKQLERLVRFEPFQGSMLSDWAADWSRNRINRVTRQVRMGLALGESSEALVRRLRGTKAANFTDGVLSISRRSAHTIVRTAATHARSQGDVAFAKENAPRIKELVFSAVLDTRTSDVCRINDGRTFKPDDEKALRPPLHPNCRSVLIPRWKRQGEVQDESYFEWLSRQSNELQEEALGKTKARLFRAGGIDGKDLINQATGRPYNLEELRRREAEAFEKAGIQ